MKRNILLMMSILGVVAISGCIVNSNPNNPTPQQNILTQPLGQAVPSVIKACFQGKPQPYNYVTFLNSCNVGNTCNLQFHNDIYLRQVPSGSMCPTLYIGDYMILMRTNGNNTNFKIGDTLNYQIGNLDIFHRVVEYCDGGYVLRGDFNNVDDGCILYNNIVGIEVALIKGIK